MMECPCSERSFPADVRIKKNHEFQRLYRTGRRIALPYFVIYYQKRESGPSRLGITASRKVGNAVTRNSCKRYIREIFRDLRCRLLASVDLSVQFRPNAATIPFEKLKSDFEEALADSGLVPRQ